MSVPLRPYYKGGPIRTNETLARALGQSVNELFSLADGVESHYREVKIEKGDGSFRICWDPSIDLRRIQRSIVRNLLREVYYPAYLHGSLPGRDYVSNAAAHKGARWSVCLDINSFFPSVSATVVQDVVWRGFFGAAMPVAELLARLTTLRGQLPQGSLTASYIANLVLWRHESRLVERLVERGFRYTRYVDDITVSSSGYPLPEAKTYVVNQVNNMLRMNGFRQKRSKTAIATRGSGIKVVGLSVGSSVGRSKTDRNRLEMEVLSYSGVAAAMPVKESLRLFRQICGRINEMARYHPREAKHLLTILENLAAEASKRTPTLNIAGGAST